MTKQIPLRNRQGEIVANALVSDEHYDHLIQFKWCKERDYVGGIVNGKQVRLHRYILGTLMGENIEDLPVDHINEKETDDPLNNTIENLRVSSASENARNRKKKDGTTSKYIGVSFDNNSLNRKWKTSASINNRSIYASYESEAHAARHYNLLMSENEFNTAKLNTIDANLLADFVRYENKQKPGPSDTLPIGITKLNYEKENSKFVVRFKLERYIFDSLQEAIDKNDSLRTEAAKIKEELRINTPPKRNEKGQCIIELFNKNKDKVAETLVDENKYYELTKYCWYLDKGDDVRGKVNGKMAKLSRVVMNYDGKDIVDHIEKDKNGKRLDNRVQNLRIITIPQNSMNKVSRKGSSSKYVGVGFDKKSGKWRASITINGTLKNLGNFENEDDAARTRDEATKEHYKEFGKLNF
jgi:hypothetical protein